MKRLPLLFAVLACAAPAGAVPAPADPAAAFGAADQKLIDRYTAALRAKFGLAACAVESGALAVELPGGAGKLRIDIQDARSEDAVEERILQALKPAKRESGESKAPLYIVAGTADDLFKGAVADAGAPAAEADLAAKAAGNDYKALLDLKQGKISFPGQTQEIVFKINDKPARRAVVRRGEDGALAVTLDGDDYAFVTARVAAGGKADREPVKTGAASVYFEFNVWMQKALKAADGRAEKEKAPKLSDGGYRHPSFEKLMAQVQGGLNSDSLNKTFENAGAQAPANLEARAQAARELAASGYGGAARWKINANGKYADEHGNLTLLVRANGPAAPGGKIEETPVVIKRNAKGGYDLDAAVAPVTRLLLEGKMVAARAQAYETAAAASPAEIVAETFKTPGLALTGPGPMGFAGAPDLRKADAVQAEPDPALKPALERRAEAERRDLQAKAVVAKTCDGKPGCAPEGIVQRPEIPSPTAPPLESNTACVINIEPGPDQKIAVDGAKEPLPDWAKERPHFYSAGDGAYASAVGCVHTGNRGLLDQSRDIAMAKLRSLASCSAGGSMPRISQFVTFRTKSGDTGSCAQASMKTGS